MTAIAQGIKKITVFKIQSALGTPATTGAQVLRRKSSMFEAVRATFQADEILQHHQDTGVQYGLKSTTGKIEGLLSATTWQTFYETLLEKLAAATSAMTIGTDLTSTAVGSVGGATFADGSSGYLTAGLKIGDVGRFTGFTTTATGNNTRNFLITALTAALMTGIFLDGAIAYTKAETGSVTFTVVGKKIVPPLTAHTNNYITVEEYYSDITRSDLFTDLKVSQMAIAMPGSGNATVSVDLVGLGRTLGAAQTMTTPTTETQTGVMAASNGVVYANGSAMASCTGATFTIANSAAPMDGVIGSNSSPDVSKGRIKVSGSFTALFDAATLESLYDAETPIGITVVALSAGGSATADVHSITCSRIKITSDKPDDGEKGIIRTYSWVAEIDMNGSSVLASDNTIITIQDSGFA